MERGGGARLPEAVFEDGATARLFLRLRSNRRTGVAPEPRPRGAERHFGARGLRGGGRVRPGQRGEAQLRDLLGALADLTLDADTAALANTREAEA